MVEKGEYPSQSELLSLAGETGRMRGTFALSSAQHPLEAKRMISELGASEVKE